MEKVKQECNHRFSGEHRRAFTGETGKGVFYPGTHRNRTRPTPAGSCDSGRGERGGKGDRRREAVAFWNNVALVRESGNLPPRRKSRDHSSLSSGSLLASLPSFRTHPWNATRAHALRMDRLVSFPAFTPDVDVMKTRVFRLEDRLLTLLAGKRRLHR